MRRRVLWSATAVVVLVLAVAVVRLATRHPAPPPGCTAVADGASYALDPEQAANASTIAAVGKRLGLPNHAVTIALATALQESKLHNVEYGDLDSLGLFQQRPSQGWGSAADVMNPAYAAEAFYRHLSRVRGWQTLAVAEAAQAVQHSAGGYAYAQWEPQARGIARALTGEVSTGIGCHFRAPRTSTAPRPDAALRAEAGAPTLGVDLTGERGWVVATWLVAHAFDYGITEVSYDGKVWTNSSSRWHTTERHGGGVTYRRVPPPKS